MNCQYGKTTGLARWVATPTWASPRCEDNAPHRRGWGHGCDSRALCVNNRHARCHWRLVRQCETRRMAQLPLAKDCAWCSIKGTIIHLLMLPDEAGSDTDPAIAISQKNEKNAVTLVTKANFLYHPGAECNLSLVSTTHLGELNHGKKEIDQAGNPEQAVDEK